MKQLNDIVNCYQLRVREGFRKTLTLNRANTFFGVFLWQYVMTVKFSNHEWLFSVDLISFCLWSRGDEFVSTLQLIIRPHYVEYR